MPTAPPSTESIAIERVDVGAYKIPTDAPESDGTFAWDSTTLIVVHVHAGDQHGLGYTYGSKAVATLIDEALAEVLRGKDAMDIPAAWDAMWRRLRNAGQAGVGAMAVSAIDLALWDLKAKSLGQPLAQLLGKARSRVMIYGSGGFTSYDEKRLAEQLAGWVDQGIVRVKMKVGRDPQADVRRVATARHVIGEKPDLFVDANGAYPRKLALRMARIFAERDAVTWFEEPRPSDDLEGLRWLREHGPAELDVAAGEYGNSVGYFQRMLDAQAVDCVQADVTRCGGVTGFLKASALCEARLMPLSGHTAPAAHVHVCCAAPSLRHLEYFHDHVRVEGMLFDGGPRLVDGALEPDWSQPGLGLTFKHADARQYAV